MTAQQDPPTPNRPSSVTLPGFLPLRLGGFYAAYFCVIGVMLPYWPLFLQGRGLSAEQIGLVVAAHFG